MYYASSILWSTEWCTGGWLSNIYINNWSVIFLFEKRRKNKCYKLFHFQINNNNLWKFLKVEKSISIELYFKSFIIFPIRSFNSSQTQSDGWCAEVHKDKSENWEWSCLNMTARFPTNHDVTSFTNPDMELVTFICLNLSIWQVLCTFQAVVIIIQLDWLFQMESERISRLYQKRNQSHVLFTFVFEISKRINLKCAEFKNLNFSLYILQS